MPSIILPSRWTRQPQYPVEVDWNNPLTAGMRFAFQFIGGQCRDAITGARGAPSGSPTATVISQGQAIDIDGSDYFSVAHNTSHDLLESITLVWGGVIDTAGAYQHFAGKHSGGGGINTPFDFRTDNSTPLKISLVRAGASGYALYDSTQTLSTGVWGLYGVSQYTDIRGSIRFYKDGVGAAGNYLGGGATGAATSAGDPLVIGRRPDGAVQLDGKVGLLYGWARALNDAEHLALYINPWQVFKPRRRVLYFETAGGGDITGALAATESGSDTAELTGDVLISGALAATESGADTAALSGDVSISGALAATESGTDTAAFLGEGASPAVTGTLAAAESGADTCAVQGKVYVAGQLSAVEGALDAFAASGNILVSGTLAATETGSDTASFTGPTTTTLTAADLDAIFNYEIEPGITFLQVIRILLAPLAGKRVGLVVPTNAYVPHTEYYMAQDGVTPRVTFTPDDLAGNGTPVVDGS